MPTDTSVDLGGELWSTLLRSAMWIGVSVALVGTVAGWLALRRPAQGRWAATVLGSPGAQPEPRPRRFLRIAFGLLWIVDGLLQAQPRMPAAFASDVLQAHSTGPGWFTSLTALLARTWARHPVLADAATVWVQVGIGVALILARSGVLLRVALWISIAWALVVWVVGEGFGGLIDTGATWLTGAPGAALVYVVAAGLLLRPPQEWETGRTALLARRSVAAWLVVGAGLQLLPYERVWRSAGAVAPFEDAHTMHVPGVLGSAIDATGRVAAAHPVALNLLVVALLVAVAAALWLDGRPGTITLGVALCIGTWWLAQGFGVLGGAATDPNTALPLALLLVSGTTSAPAEARSVERVPRAVPGWLAARAAAAATLAFATIVAVPAVLALSLPGGADAAAVKVDSAGGLRRIPARPAPAFDLIDQRGKRVSITSLHGKLVVLTFLDPVCNSDCPLVANQLAIADRRLGAAAGRVDIVAVDTNPLFHARTDVDAFTRSHGLSHLSNWHFVTGPPAQVQDVLAAYGVTVAVPAVGMIEHTEAIYFITPDGRQAAYLDDGAASTLTRTYADLVGSEIKALLG